MDKAQQAFIDGAWVTPQGDRSLDVVNPASEEVIGTVRLGDANDVDRAVIAAQSAFETFSQTSVDDRIALLDRICAAYKPRFAELGAVISREMGAPLAFASRFQAGAGYSHFKAMTAVLKSYAFEEAMGSTLIRHEPIGVAGMITPWNWPANQITCKVAAALGAGCTMILKPSEMAPYTAILIAEILEEAGVPPGVFNLIQGDGLGVGQALAAHPDIDMISFTGSTRAGIAVAQAAAPTVKRVGQELGGKSANIILDDADLEKAVAEGVMACFRNSGQSCNAPTRMIVPAEKIHDVTEIAGATAEGLTVGDPKDDATNLGPVVSKSQWDKIQGFIETGISEGAKLVAGGPGRPDGLNRGYYVRPTVFSAVTPDMTIAREEIFGPVLAIMPAATEEEALRIANNSPYGLSGYVQSGSIERARAVAARMRTAQVHVNGAPADPMAPFGGYKQSGNGREWGRFGLEEYLEVKAVLGGAG